MGNHLDFEGLMIIAKNSDNSNGSQQLWLLTMCQVKCCTYTTSLDLLTIYGGALSVTVYQGPNRGFALWLSSIPLPFLISI